ncbi:hypothetical protein BDA99DRAFT_565473 [Phascolomyces articulosus]|uniref:Uncharacterized protein n=1 Tax=Phascolomyces articulosus TaxID=60185 RepID=A0AAD5P842_9FUNG|nr:hypothetical protein BDA99DRAFT_565473 [Phascolomyces articulosus]
MTLFIKAIILQFPDIIQTVLLVYLKIFGASLIRCTTGVAFPRGAYKQFSELNLGGDIFHNNQRSLCYIIYTGVNVGIHGDKSNVAAIIENKIHRLKSSRFSSILQTDDAPTLLLLSFQEYYYAITDSNSNIMEQGAFARNHRDSYPNESTSSLN